MNFNYICCLDFETGSKNKNKTQPTQLACVMIDARKLEIVKDSHFNSEIRPILDDAKAIELGLDPVSDEALEKTRKTREQLASAPILSDVWQSFTSYVKKYNKKDGNTWNAPVRGGFNIKNFDNTIIDRLCKEYGPYDNEYQSQNLFHPLHYFDIIDDLWRVTDNIRISDNNSISFETVREWLGMSTEGAHDALIDVIDCAEIMIRFMKLYRKLHTGIPCISCSSMNKIKFEGSLSKWTRPQI